MTEAQLAETMELLGVSPQDFEFSDPEAVARFKQRVQKRYRELVKKFHPDVNSCQSSEDMVRLNQVVHDLLHTEFVIPRGRRIRFTIRG